MWLRAPKRSSKRYVVVASPPLVAVRISLISLRTIAEPTACARPLAAAPTSSKKDVQNEADVTEPAKAKEPEPA
jgi:hypothetical protein